MRFRQFFEEEAIAASIASKWEVSKHGKGWITRYSFAGRYITRIANKCLCLRDLVASFVRI
jgi:hypothetical protein